MSTRAIRIALPLVAVMALVFSGCHKKRSTIAKPTAPPPIRVPAAPKAPTASATASEIGLASWYGYPFHGRQAANGEIYDMEKLTAAHKTLPFGTWVRVTNLSNNKTVEVRITDRGPFIAGRIIDLSHAAAQEVELIGPGVAQVRIEVVSTPGSQLAGSLYSVQAGIFKNRNQAEDLREALGKRFGAARLIYKDGRPASWRLLVGVEDTMEDAKALARKIQSEAGSGFVVRLDEIPATSAAR